MNIKYSIKVVLGFLLISLLGGGAVGCTHPKTPEGHEGYVYHKPLIFGMAEYRKTMRGPASTGLSWRLYVTNVDMRAKSYKEDFQLLTSDNLSVKFEVNTRIRLRSGSAKEIVEDWGGAKWYDWNVKEPLRTIVRREITKVSAIQIQLKTNSVRALIYSRLLKRYKTTPIQVESVDIGNIQFPKQVTRAIERKIGQKQELERQEFLLAKTRKEAAIRVLEALKAAKQQLIISSTLNPLYVQRRAVQVYRKLAESPNKTVIMLPNSVKGTGLPVVLTDQEHKELSEEDRQLLKRMERKYTKIASKTRPSKVKMDITRKPKLKSNGEKKEGAEKSEKEEGKSTPQKKTSNKKIEEKNRERKGVKKK